MVNTSKSAVGHFIRQLSAPSYIKQYSEWSKMTNKSSKHRVNTHFAGTTAPLDTVLYITVFWQKLSDSKTPVVGKLK